MSCLFGFFLMLIAIDVSLSDNLLIFGDSIDRQTVIEWCQLQRMHNLSVTEDIWGGPSLKYSSGQTGRMPSLICARSNDTSIAFLHMFGSCAHGPYLNRLNNSVNDPFVDTASRIDHAFDIYVQHFGFPSRVMLQFANWDIQDIIRNKVKYPLSARQNKTVTDSYSNWFRDNMLERIQQIKKLTANSDVDIGLRTAVRYFNSNSEVLLHAFNTVTRELAKSENLTLFDFDEDIWSMARYDYSQEHFLFRDFIHPKQYYTAVAGSKMLGLQYSAYMIYSQKFADIYRTRFEGFYLHSEIAVHFLRHVKSSKDESMYFLNRYDNVLQPISNPDFIRVLKFGPGDILNVSFDPTSKFAPGPTVPSCFKEKMMFTMTNLENNTNTFCVHNYTIRKIPNEVVIGQLELLNFTMCKEPVHHAWMHSIPLVSFGTEVSPQLNVSDGTLIRYAGSRYIFYLENQVKKHVQSMGVLAQMKKTLDDVIVFPHEEDLYFFG